MTKGNVIVTGAARGIGKGIALRLARDGFTVVVNDLASQQNYATDTVNEITQAGGKAVFIPADVSKKSEVEALISKSVENFGNLNVFVANAAVIIAKPLLETSEDEWDQISSVNVRGTFNSYTAAAAQFIKQGTPGKIIGAASIAAFHPYPLLGAYVTTKFSIRALTQASAIEWGKHNITVNAFAPGIVDTPMWDILAAAFGQPREQVMTGFANTGAIPRISKPEDVAKLVSFLCSSDSDFVTGQTILVDGGIQFS